MAHARLSELVEQFKADYDEMGLERLDGEEAEYSRMSEALTTLPFLVSKKFVVLRNPSANKQFVEKAAQLFTEISDTTDVVILETKVDKRSSYYKLLKKATQYQEFSDLDPEGLAKWIVGQVSGQGGEISLANARILIDRVGSNQQMLANEVQKLLTYEPEISKTTIELLTEKAPQSTIFELIDVAMNGNSKRALELYIEQRQQKVEPQQIIAMLAWQMHVLAVVKSAGNKDANSIASEAKLSPYVVRKVQGLARRLTMADIKRLIAELLELDISLKTKSIDADEALQNYLLISLGDSQ